jgi:hypothetical protein
MIPTFFLGGAPMQGAKWDSLDDPYWAQTTLILRMNGADGSSTFNDSSSFGRTVTASNSTDFTVSTAQSKSGGTSCKCTGDGGTLRATNTSATELTGDFTAEAWVYYTAAPASSSAPFGLYRALNTYLMVKFWTDRKPYLGDTADVVNGTTAMSLNAWHHVAITRTGSTIRMWLDGTQEGGTYTNASTYCTNGEYTYIGSGYGGTVMMGAATADPYIDLVRITKADRYGTSSFTPPADY